MSDVELSSKGVAPDGDNDNDNDDDGPRNGGGRASPSPAPPPDDLSSPSDAAAPSNPNAKKPTFSFAQAMSQISASKPPSRFLPPPISDSSSSKSGGSMPSSDAKGKIMIASPAAQKHALHHRGHVQLPPPPGIIPKGKIAPVDPADVNLERQLRHTAALGVVRLFNAVRSRQKEAPGDDEEDEHIGPTSSSQARVSQEREKNDFIARLKRPPKPLSDGKSTSSSNGQRMPPKRQRR